jgi:2-polyprenyl-6-methoxyphenol hydroxylase-like FAD-dependent oxidoreductase
VPAKYLVGRDGGRSLIHKKAGIDFPGWGASTSYLIAEVEMTERAEGSQCLRTEVWRSRFQMGIA